MAKPKNPQEKAIPSSRGSRLLRMARMAGGVAGGMLAEGGRQLRDGKRPQAKSMLLTPGNAKRVAEQMSAMRGAAMKVGQMLSMDAGEFLPKELTDIFATLRDDANYMPPRQLHTVMSEAFGEEWESKFYGFDVKPIAAASIGQVHKTVSPNGREIVLKVQYPGIAESIDSDVDNIASLLRLSGLLPDGIDITPLLEDAKAQLHDEADYLREAKFLRSFQEQLAKDERFVVPDLIEEFTRKNVLAMSFEPGVPIEALLKKPQEERNRVMTALFDLLLMELFDLQMMQTDPNFANYQYREKTGQIVLLDFGATRHFKKRFINNYRKMATAALAGDTKKVAQAAESLGYAISSEVDSSDEEANAYRELVLEVLDIGLEPLCFDGVYDFGRSDMNARMAELGENVRHYRKFWQLPPTDAVFLHRKLGGMFLLASKLKTQVNLRELATRWLD